MIIFSDMFRTSLLVSDADIVMELFTKKNSIYDKDGKFEAIFSAFMGESFLFSKANEAWKAKRKACAHAFYKSRLTHMLETLKDKIEANCEEWAA